MKNIGDVTSENDTSTSDKEATRTSEKEATRAHLENDKTNHASVICTEKVIKNQNRPNLTEGTKSQSSANADKRLYETR